MDAHGLGQEDDIGDFTDLGRLDIEGQEGELEPAPVAGGTFNAPYQQHGDEGRVEEEQQCALTGQNVYVQRGHGEIHKNARKQGAGLDDDVSHASLGVGGGIDHDDAENGGHNAQRQQDHIAFSENIEQPVYKFLHDLTSRVFIYSTIIRGHCKQKSMFCKKPGDMIQ